MECTVRKSPLNDFDALVVEANDCVFVLSDHGAVTVLHGGEGCANAFSRPDETDEMQDTVLAGVGAHDALMPLDAQGWNHYEFHKLLSAGFACGSF